MVAPSVVLRPVPGFMAMGILGESMKFIPRKGRKPLSTKQMMRGFTNIMVGTSLITPTAGMINQL